jgi:acetyl-CoA carboxylase carboxyltransferase component
VRALLDVLADTGSVLELRRGFAPGMVTAFARVEGRAVGVLANDPTHLGGAIDADGADKAARFLALCDAHDLPVLVLCDTPGFMVGPEHEDRAAVRHVSRMFVVGANLSVPLVGVVTRKAYGLGAQAMLGGHTKAPVLTVGWPTSELGPMGLEGAVRLGFRRELEAIEDPDERAERERQMVEFAQAHAEGLNVASFAEIDDVIDPADTRRRVADALALHRPRAWDERPARWVDTW